MKKLAEEAEDGADWGYSQWDPNFSTKGGAPNLVQLMESGVQTDESPPTTASVVDDSPVAVDGVHTIRPQATASHSSACSSDSSSSRRLVPLVPLLPLPLPTNSSAHRPSSSRSDATTEADEKSTLGASSSRTDGAFLPGISSQLESGRGSSRSYGVPFTPTGADGAVSSAAGSRGRRAQVAEADESLLRV
ncbi:hypothetical protein T492DRAFT_876301 [Pavlovales sp. CCMP2436]|nr:hypothetical protein T492DRAFT_876301 [Pavlovales sp. CCMP2436]